MTESPNPLPFDSFMNPGLGKYSKVYRESIETPEKFYEGAAWILDWYSKWDSVLDKSNEPYYKWFVNGKLNVCYNAVDRHANGNRRNKAAYIWPMRKEMKKLSPTGGCTNVSMHLRGHFVRWEYARETGLQFTCQ